MTKRLYFFVSLHDALRISNELSQLGVSRYHVQPHDLEVAFVFERVSEVTQVVLRRLFGTDGVSQQD
ncbi:MULTISPECIES: hypothetical protein [Brevibacillus]|jgi:hypothetical protein|uniref:Uncharacterized protein n=1 Tax=Brevibacillus borstelensis AK1 TaxID=1300222 RepID=M8DVI0_9BACL|nr:hypothetical protein [Brevibacillus borstelensis]EMT51001.1 hypothetical protein I532_20386 [Brevibacillus borstelensis AK1]KKX53608.1 hypothetical protein X546_18285 [Brevibacillus borstelensis cifa_chp40]MBE5394971.1 hypothetical protein [Brevibacillus borstelensis]MCC0567310.1 hypothetical protein [Brevibacillus borstelensis]MCM3473544.1 hypothetical protein [Brevibacillus borstelensis]